MKMLKFLFYLVAIIAPCLAQCPERFEEGPDNHCYLFYESERDWVTARGYCNAFSPGADLVVIDDQAEFDWLVDNTTSTDVNASWWIGYSDISEEGRWRWTDCGETTAWHQTLWAPGNPGNGADDCGILLPTGEIDDIVCDRSLNFICEITQKDFSIDDAGPTNVRANATGTLRISMYWDVAQTNCDVFGYRIRITDDRMETTQHILYGGDIDGVEVIVDRVNTEYSITVAALLVNDVETNETDPVTVTTGPCPDNFEEAPNGRCYNFRNPDNGEWWPSGRKGCDNTEDGDLAIINNEEELEYIMNRTAQIDANATWWVGLSDLASDGDWRWVDCAESNDWQNRLWAPGYPRTTENYECAFLNPDAMLTDDACDRRIWSICEVSPKDFDVDRVMVDDVMASGISISQLEVTWSLPKYSCDAVGFQIYYVEQDSAGDTERIFVSGGDKTQGVIPDLRASTTYNVTVAVYNSKDQELPQTMPVSGTTKPCPSNYEEGPNGHCYMFSYSNEAGVQWDWAKGECMTQPDSDLVIIDDDEELTFLRNRMAESNVNRDWWIGYSGYGEWQWVDCEEPGVWQESLWAPGSPDPTAPGCGILENDDGLIHDVVCDVKHHFICEMNIKGFTGEDQNVQDLSGIPAMYGFEVRWVNPDKNCDVYGFRIISVEAESGKQHSDIQYPGDSTSSVITGLLPFTRYNVTVTALLTTQEELSPVGPIQLTTLPCPASYEEGPNGHCYRFGYVGSEYGNMWYWGRQYCMVQTDSDLVIIDDAEELNFLMNRTAEINETRDWWIGISSFTAPDWYWTDCDASTLWQETLWAPNNPTLGQLGCGLLEEDGFIHESFCDVKHHYICEINLKGYQLRDENVQSVSGSSFVYGLEVNWVVAETNCDVYAYKITYQEDIEGAKDHFIIQYGSDSTSATITEELNRDSTYNISVSALLNIDVQLPPVGPIQLETLSCPALYEEGPNGHCYRFGYAYEYGDMWHYSRQYCVVQPDSDLVIIDDEEELDFLQNRIAEINMTRDWWVGLSSFTAPDWFWTDCDASTPWQEDLWAPGSPSMENGGCGVLEGDGFIRDSICDVKHHYICEFYPKGFQFRDQNVQSVSGESFIYGFEVNWVVAETNCDVYAYKITYQEDIEGSKEHFVIQYGSDSTSASITEELNRDSTYNISISALLTIDFVLPPVGPIQLETLPCPALYEEGPNGHCYRFGYAYEYGDMWHYSRQYCVIQPDSDLVIIDDEEELTFLQNRIAEINKTRDWWVGLSSFTAPDWFWTDCDASTPWQEDLWAPGSPSMENGGCGVLKGDGFIRDSICDVKHHYICEFYPKGFQFRDQNVKSVSGESFIYGFEVNWVVAETNCDVYAYKITYQEDIEGSKEHFVIQYGSDSTSASITEELNRDSTYNISISALLTIDVVLPPVGPIQLETLPCPALYEEGPNGHCYRFGYAYEYGDMWHYSRQYCVIQPDSDLVIIDDEEELTFLQNRIAEINKTRDWWVGLSSFTAPDWFWTDCDASTPWQEDLWAPGSPSMENGGCGVLEGDGFIRDSICDVKHHYICEFYPKGFQFRDQNVQSVSGESFIYGFEVNWVVAETNCDVYAYKITYQEDIEGSKEHFVIQYGSDSTSASITEELNRDSTYNISISALLTIDVVLPPVGPIQLETLPCPALYEEGPNGHCYRFGYAYEYGDMWHYSRQYCVIQPDSDLVIIDDEEELTFLQNRIAEINKTRDWWVGLSSFTAPDWFWTDCDASTPWQEDLWAPGSPSMENGGCGVLEGDGFIRDSICDVKHHYICEFYPKGFQFRDQNVQSVSGESFIYGFEVNWVVAETNCDVYAYKITYQEDIEGSKEHFVIQYGSDSTSASITEELNRNSIYNISISALLTIDVALPPVGPIQLETLPCPALYEEGPNGHCYRFGYAYEYGDMWHYSRQYCVIQPDSDLVIIDDEEELTFLQNRIAEINKTRDWWVGLSSFTAPDWFWTDCDASTPWQEDLWAPGSPSMENGGCGVLKGDGFIRDSICDVKHHYICEFYPKGFQFRDQNVQSVSGESFIYGFEVNWVVAETNCDVYAYKITYQEDIEGSKEHFVIQYGSDSTSASITEELNRNSIYNISISALLTIDFVLPPVGPIQLETLSCPALYEEGPNGHCYRFGYAYEYGDMWHYSRQYCVIQPDSDLVIIDDEEELAFLQNRITEINMTRDWWIGLSSFTAPDWFWTDCEASTPWQEDLWAPGSPTPGNVGCALLEGDGFIHDTVCDVKHHYICEFYPKGFQFIDQNVQSISGNSYVYGFEVNWVVAETNCDVYAYKITYQEDIEGAPVNFVIQYGRDSTSASITEGLDRDSTYSVSVSALLNIDVVLPTVGPIHLKTLQCPARYEEGPNGHCYRFGNAYEYGDMWHYSRQYCVVQRDSDLAIIDDEEELSFLKNRIAESNSTRDWWIGLSSFTAPDWFWTDCEASTPWQEDLWAPGSPTPGESGCGLLEGDGFIRDSVCDTKHHYICEIFPKGFSMQDQNVQSISGSSSVYGFEVNWVVAETNCDVFAYKITYQEDVEGAPVNFVIEHGKDSTSAYITDLNRNSTYNVSVSALLTVDVVLSPVGPIQLETLACPDDYEVGPNGHCYKFYHGYEHGYMWHWGRQNCMDEPDSDLVIIDNEEELTFLQNRIAEINETRDWWIGISSFTAPDWFWTDCDASTPWQEDLWAPGSPTPGNVGCGLLEGDGFIHESICDVKHHYICEIYPKGFALEEENVKSVSGSPISYGMEVNWVVAEPNCDVYGYRVTYQEDVDDSRENFVIQYGRDSTSTSITGLYPDSTHNISVAALLNLDMDLSPVGPIHLTTPSCPDGFEEGPNHRCYRFRILDDGSWWPTGRRTCDNEVDSDLAIINDAEELSFLLNRSAEIDPNMTWWIGLSDLTIPGEWGWVDCTPTTPYQDTLWAPGYPMENTLGTCAALQPSGDVIDLPCDRRFSYFCEVSPKGFDWVRQVSKFTAEGGMYTIDVTWMLPDGNCDAVGYKIYYIPTDGSDIIRYVFVEGVSATNGTITGLPASTSYNVSVAIYTSKDVELEQTEPVVASTVPCPQYYEQGPNGKCYRFRILTYGSWWATGRRTCDDEPDSDLAIINDPDELAFLLNRTAEISPEMTWWIGYSDQSVQDDWRWIDCSTSTPWQETLWVPDHPGNGYLDCAALQPDGQIVDLVCDTALSYLCEISPKGFTDEDASPQNLNAVGTSYGIDVSWTISPTSCDVVLYRVSYYPKGQPADKSWIFVYGGDTSSAHISGLPVNSTYDVTVAAYLSKDIELSPVGPVTATTAPCPDGYEEGPNGRCYWFRILDDGSWWPTGRRTCDNEVDSDLAIINDAEELSFLLNRSAEINPNMTWWIGLSDLTIPGEWGWVDCTPTTPYQDTLWAPGYPMENTLGTCAALQPSGQVIDLPCDRRFSYFCEVSPKGFDWVRQVSEFMAEGGMYTIDVTWMLPDGNCDAVGYKIYYIPTDGSDIIRYVFVEGISAMNGTITGLPASTSYNVSVAIYTSKDVELEQTESLVASTVPCPQYYEQGPNGKCYRFRILTYGSWWATGRRTCDDEPDSDLAIINDPDELAFLLNRTAEINPEMTWWIGYSDQSVQDDWRWIDCSTSTPWQETLWVPGHPGNGYLDCAALQPDGQIVDLVCDTALSYLCEISPKGFSDEDASPQNLSAVGTSYGIDVSWTISPTSCDVVLYRVSYYPTGQPADKSWIFVYGGDTSSAHISGLPVDSAYDVTVAAYLSKDIELSPVGPVTATTASCPDGYEEGPNGRCYRFRILDDGSWWPTGRRTCDNEVDSDLAIINDAEELSFLLNRSAEINPNMTWWIGLSDLTIPGEWGWVDCTPTTPYQDTLWAPGYPMENTLGTCAALQPSGDVIDLPCDRRFSYFCEVSPKGFDWVRQVSEFTAEGGMYTIDVTWMLPDGNCDAVGYKIYYIPTDGSDIIRYVYVEGVSAMNGTITGLPASTSYNVSVAIYTSKDVELEQTESLVASTVPCPQYYEQGPNGKCYRFRILTYGSWWATGRRTCDDEPDSDLAIINDPDELAFLLNRTAEINPEMTWWIGYSDQSVQDDWRWIDCSSSTPWQETLWVPGHPGNGYLDCAALQPDGQIVDLVCDTALSYLCEISPKGFSDEDANPRDLNAIGTSYGIDVTWTVSPTSCDVVLYRVTYYPTGQPADKSWIFVYGGDTSSAHISGLPVNSTYDVTVAAYLSKDIELSPVGPVTATTAPCPDGYEEGPNGRCYRFRILDDGSWWPTGRRTCDNEVDSDLAIINDAEELSFLLNRSAEIDPNMTWWIGLSDLTIPGEWGWVDCTSTTPYQDTLWAPGYPMENTLGTCAALQPSGDVIDLPCDRRFSYFCEVSPKGFDWVRQVSEITAEGGMYTIDVTWMLPDGNCDAVGYKIYYIPTDGSDIIRYEFVEGISAMNGTITGLPANTSYSVSVAIYTSKDVELEQTEPLIASTVPCPVYYEQGPNGKCYRFRILTYGSWWATGRRTCDDEPDSDLAIINDPDELAFLLNRTAEINPDMTWWIGYSDQSVQDDWRWIDCSTSTPWQETLWVPDHPGNGYLDCAALQPDGQIVDLVCDTALSYLCEISPKGFSDEDANPSDLNATGTAYGIDVSWTVSSTSCDVVLYRVTYYPTGQPADKSWIFVYGGDTSSAHISGLPVDSTYDITVAAYLSKDIELSPVGPVTATTETCPEDYELAPNGRCYLFVSNTYGSFWHYGRSTCQDSMNSDLAIINDQAELTFIMDRIGEIDDSRDWWIGYSDQSVEGQWKWVDCTQSNDWQLSIWAPGYPGNGMQDCAALTSSGDIESKVCDNSLSYVCEVSYKGFDPYETKVQDLVASGASYGTKISWTLPENNCDTYGYRIYYTENDEQTSNNVILYGGDTTEYRLLGIKPNTQLDVSIATLIVDDELEPVGPVTVTSDPCPPNYEEADNGRCYRFGDFGPFGKDFDNSRYYCKEDTDNFEHDLMIIDDQWELEYITNRTREFQDGRDWRIGYTDLAVESEWRWVTCESPDQWQEDLWKEGYPKNGQDDCGVFDPVDMTIYDDVCDVMDINFICEVTPKEFAPGDDNVRNVNASAVDWDTIMVMWDVAEFNCDVIAYNIYYQDTYLGDEPARKVVYGGGVTNYNLTGLEPTTSYSITVAAERTDMRLPEVGPVYATTPEGPCPAYYVVGQAGGCYKFVTSEHGTMWADARSSCDNVGVISDLVVIDDQVELDWILGQMAEFDSLRDWWIGFSDISVESDWRWVTCDASDAWQETLWETGHPISSLNDCGALTSSTGKIVDNSCDKRMYYICEFTPKPFSNEDMNVKSVMADPLSASEIQVSWELSNVTCNVYGYKVYYHITGEEFDVTSFELAYGGNETSLVVGNLLSTTSYDFYAAALIPDRLELPKVGPATATTPDSCQLQIITSNSTISNADYPQGYSGPGVCDWLISASTNQYALLQITDFDTVYGADFVVIGSGDDFDPENTLYTLSGDQDTADDPPIPGKILSPGQHLWLSFRPMDSTTEHRGFQMDVTMDTQGPGTPVRQYIETDLEGTLSSPGYPNQYDNFQDITWTLIGPKTSHLRIISLEGSLEDGYDELIIGAGVPDMDVLGTFTGALELNEPLISETYQMWVRFRADETVTGAGFQLYWESYGDPDSCGTEELSDESGTVTSPNFPEPYPNDQECIWIIRLPVDTSIVRLEFSAFTLETDVDFLYVGSGDSVNENVLEILTGDSLPSPIESQNDRMWLKFSSDESFAEQGFSLEYSSIDGGEPPTEYNQIQDSVVFIVLGESEEWFTPPNQNALANAIATSMSNYCSGKSDTCENVLFVKRDAGILELTFSSEDVEFLGQNNVGSDLHIITWVRNPSTASDTTPVGITDVVVQEALVDEASQATFQEHMGESFEYDVVPQTGATAGPPPESLDAWIIAVIATGSVVLLIILAILFENRHRRKLKQSMDLTDNEALALDEIPSEIPNFDVEVPESNQALENKGYSIDSEDDRL